MIAFALVVLCVFPLIAPHSAMLRNQTSFIRKVELDHLVNLLFGHLVEQLYANKIPWQDLENETIFPITEELLKEAGFTAELPFEGTYTFVEKQRKPKKEDNKFNEYVLYIFELKFAFHPKGEKPTQDEQIYAYPFFLARNLTGMSPLPKE
nr:type II secretion system protein [Parachlamydia sp. AcF125]